MTDPSWAPQGPQRPQVDDLGFDHRLMTPARLLRLAGKSKVKFSEAGLAMVYLDCAGGDRYGACGRAVEVLTDQRGGCYTITVLQFLSNVLRHQVLRHDLPLSGGDPGDLPRR